MCKYEKLFLGIVLGAIIPLIGFLAGWWSTSQMASNAWVFIAALVGLIIGIIVDALILKKWVSKAFEMDLRLWMGILFSMLFVCLAFSWVCQCLIWHWRFRRGWSSDENLRIKRAQQLLKIERH